jgi:hypothetical protein
LVDQRSIFAAVGFLTVALADPSHAASTVTAAAITTGRLYVVGTTERPHTKVSLNDKFTAESDDRGKFQFELVYYPVGCVVRTTIDGKTIETTVQHCGEICTPAPQSSGLVAPKLGRPESPGRPSSAAPPLIPPGGMALTAPEMRATGGAFAPPASLRQKAGTTAHPTPQATPPRRPSESTRATAKSRAPVSPPRPPVTRAQPRPKPAQEGSPDSRSPVDRPDDRTGSDIY